MHLPSALASTNSFIYHLYFNVIALACCLVFGHLSIEILHLHMVLHNWNYLFAQENALTDNLWTGPNNSQGGTHVTSGQGDGEKKRDDIDWSWCWTRCPVSDIWAEEYSSSLSSLMRMHWMTFECTSDGANEETSCSKYIYCVITCLVLKVKVVYFSTRDFTWWLVTWLLL